MTRSTADLVVLAYSGGLDTTVTVHRLLHEQGRSLVGALAPDLEILAPVRDSAMSRPEAISYADKHGLVLGGITEAKPWSIGQNLWGRTIEAGVLEDPWLAPPSDAFEWTVSPATASG